MDLASSNAGTKPSPRKRNRIALSCGHCRSRKLRCSRATPCTACVRSGDAATCSYGSKGPRENSQSAIVPEEKEALTSRIDRLEKLLLSAATNANFDPSILPVSGISQPPSISEKSEDEVSRRFIPQMRKEPIDMTQFGKELGILRVEPNQTTYHGGQHWVSTMFQIKEFREYLESHSDDLGRVALENRRARDEDISLLRGSNHTVTKEELLSSIPPRNISDILIVRFFDSVAHHIPVLHEQTFREEYIKHWTNPFETDITWLGLLFSVFHHAQLSFNTENDENHSRSYTIEYRERTIQCLLTSDYTNPQMYTIEVLVLHTYAEWMTSQDSSIDVSLLLGIIIRLAMRMGMHRDSRAYDGVKPFQGEMRRRVWTTIHMMDIVSSFQLSLPAAINDGSSRCGLPRNIYDNEFHTNVKELPPARPLSEPTEISITIAKAYLTLELGKILAFAESEDDPTNDDISRYEASLEAIKNRIPERLNISSLQQLNTELVSSDRKLVDLDRLYQTSQCVLYRTSLSQARLDPSKLRHRGRCIDAAMILLAHQATLYLDPKSLFTQNIKKRHIYTLTTHDFFTAAMAIALDLHYGFEAEPYTPCTSDMTLWGYDRRNDMIAALETSNEFCKISKEDSVEAANAHGMLSFVVAKARKAQWIIAEKQVAQSSARTGESSTINTPDSFSEPGVGIFKGSLPDFDWNLWNQFGGDDIGLFAHGGDVTSN